MTHVAPNTTKPNLPKLKIPVYYYYFFMPVVSPLGASLVIAGSSSDLMEGSAGEDDGLVIGAWSNLEDL